MNISEKSFYLLLILALLSGIAGLAYEILYMKIISNYFGDIFYISSAVLTTFFFGIAIGSFYANKFSKYLALLEIAIGVYALIFTILFYTFSTSIVKTLYIFDPTGPIVLTIMTFFLLIIPALLLGFSVPLYTLYLQHYNNHNNNTTNFKKIYILYNIGAAISVILLEYILIRLFGIAAGIITVATINIIAGFVLYYTIKPIKNIKQNNWIREIKDNKTQYIQLFIANVLTAIMYLVVLQILNLIYGPLKENFSILLSTSLIAIAIASIILLYTTISIKKLYFIISIAILGVFSLLNLFIDSWIDMREGISQNSFEFLTIKISTIILYVGFLFILFGIIEPLYYQNKKKLQIGTILGVSSLGMCAGFLTMTWFLFNYFSLLTIILIVATSFFLLSLKKKQRWYKYAIILLLFSTLTLIFIQNWPGDTLQVSHNWLNSKEQYEDALSLINSIETHKKYENSVAIINFSDNTRWLSHNGYVSLSFRDDMRTKLHESLMGMASVPFLKNHEDAFIMGLGSGITPGAATEMFDRVDVSEINPVMPKVLDELSDRNYNIESKDNVDIQIQDAQISLLTTDKKYDLIVNTVPSPYFYSASKLWSEDVYDEVSKSLDKGGIYTTWFDTRVGKKGFETMTKTIENSFNHCRYMILTSAYLLTLCSNEPIKFTNYDNSFYTKNIQEMFQYQGIEDISNHIYHRFIQPNNNIYNEETIIHTLNHPVLEYYASSRNNFDEIFREEFYSTFFSNLSYDPINNSHGSNEYKREKCNIIRSYIKLDRIQSC